MKRSITDSEWTDSATSYGSSAKTSKTKRYQRKRFKKSEMNDYYSRYTDPTVQELLIPQRVRERKARSLKRFRGVKIVTPKAKRVKTSHPPKATWKAEDAVSLAVAGAEVPGTIQAGRAVGGLAGLAMGGPAGEPIGEAVGALAAAGYTLFNLNNKLGPFRQKKQMTNARNKVTNALVGKSAMAKTGKTKVKKAKAVKVSPYLRKAIKQVNAMESAKGYYQRSFHGLVGASISIDDTEKDYQILGNVYYTTTTPAVESNYHPVMYTGHNRANSDIKTYYGGLFNQQLPTGTNTTGFVTMSYRPDTDLNFFTPGKVWHAASVLFNNKTEYNNPYTGSSANLKTIFNDTDGTSTTVGQPGMLKINVLSSSVEFTMKNMSLRTLEVDIYECVATQKLNARTPLGDMIAVADNIQDGADNKMIGYYCNDANRIAGTSRFLIEGTIDGVSLLKGHGWHWKYEKRTMVLQPQEICIHTVKGPTGVLDFKKLFDTSFQQTTTSGESVTATNLLERTACALKDWSKHCVIAVRVDPLILEKTAVDGGSNVPNFGHRYIPLTANVDGALTAPLYCEIKEKMRVAVPEVAGFQLPPLAVASGATTGGQKVQLNFRKPRIQITNCGEPNALIAGTQLVTSREENPVATQSGYSNRI